MTIINKWHNQCVWSHLYTTRTSGLSRDMKQNRIATMAPRAKNVQTAPSCMNSFWHSTLIGSDKKETSSPLSALKRLFLQMDKKEICPCVLLGQCYLREMLEGQKALHINTKSSSLPERRAEVIFLFGARLAASGPWQLAITEGSGRSQTEDNVTKILAYRHQTVLIESGFVNYFSLLRCYQALFRRMS